MSCKCFTVSVTFKFNKIEMFMIILFLFVNETISCLSQNENNFKYAIDNFFKNLFRDTSHALVAIFYNGINEQEACMWPFPKCNKNKYKFCL